jgi:hypothetical protein
VILLLRNPTALPEPTGSLEISSSYALCRLAVF